MTNDVMGRVQSTFEIRRNAFLEGLTTVNGKNKYRRYIASPLRYAGGKSLAVGLIVEKLPNNLKRLISPFMGGGAIEIACARELKIPVISCDIFDILTNYWQEQVKNPEELYRFLKKFKPTKEYYKVVGKRMKSHWKGEKILKGTELAAVYYFNHNTSYGPHFLGSQSSVYLQEERYKKTIEKVRNFNVPKLDVRCSSFEKFIPRYPNDFLYCDPPYYLGGDSKMFIGMYPHRNFPIHHKGFDHEKLRDLLLAHKGGFILSYNDCSTIRKWYKGFNMDTPTWQYTFGQGDVRIGKNRLESDDGNHIKKSHELLIWSDPK